MNAAPTEGIDTPLGYWQHHFPEHARSIHEMLTPFYRRRRPEEVIVRLGHMLEHVNSLLGVKQDTPVSAYGWSASGDAWGVLNQGYDLSIFMTHGHDVRTSLTRNTLHSIQEGLDQFVGALDEFQIDASYGNHRELSLVAYGCMKVALTTLVGSVLLDRLEIRDHLAPLFALRRDGVFLCGTTSNNEGIVMLGLPE